MSPKTESEIAAMRESGRMLATVLQVLRERTTEGLTPQDMSAIARKELQALGGEPAFLGVPGNPNYPDVICISVNNQVQHSIPNSIPFKKGDIINYDYGVKYRNMLTDGGISICVDDAVTPDTKRLLSGTEKALYDGIRAVRAGARVGDISAAIERTLRKHKLGIVRELVGHGVGHELHEDPEIPNYGRAGTGPVLRAGMTIAIEPITTLGGSAIYQARDGWTLLTQDGSWSAQFEHTVLVTSTGCEILTQL
jgi:methionyl aminopeptidase